MTSNLYKIAANAETLRRVALENGIVPGIGQKWKKIARRLVKGLSKQHPAKKSINEILPEKKHWENIAKIDNYYKDKHNMLDREFDGIVDKDYAIAQHIGTHTGTKGVEDIRHQSFHKHPGINPAPSKTDINTARLLVSDHLDDAPGTVKKDYIFTNNSKARGLAAYSAKNKGNGKTKAQLDFIYRRDPSSFDLNGNVKISSTKKRRVNSLYRLNNAERIDSINRYGLSGDDAKSRKILFDKHNEPLKEDDPNWQKYHDDIFNKEVKKLKEERNRRKK